ncbi:hypothetical protein ACFWVU_35140 [Streptomyces sp. NPDC058686]|uniref:hypothetical protein n=1 Tax=Streptomyces sp. NPDC058686 TaxID=3346599 RepID=UPI00365BA8DF
MSPFKRVLLAAGSVVAVVTLAIGGGFVRLWSGSGTVGTVGTVGKGFVRQLRAANALRGPSPQLPAYIGTLEISDAEGRCAAATSA